MYRSSTASVHTQEQHQHHHTHLLQLIEECVRQTEDCVGFTENCITSLRPGVEDLPRLSNVLQNKRCFLFVPEPTVEAHKQRIGKEVEPQIDELIARAEKSLGGLERRDATLRRKLATLQSQQQRPPPSHSSSQPRRAGPTPATVVEERRLAMICGRRDKLRRELEELEREG
ncbi:DASH complex subunit Spc19 [Mrakia frigida]|uniref:DASH complex subunit SPC19 n=1 Tax=Mrakia frigida TaxID=29902 RepID=UPI003FCBF2BB